MARNMLSHWQSEPELAGLRETEELAKLSAEDAAAPRELWSSVKAALAQPTEQTK